jgi:hypothetical protein
MRDEVRPRVPAHACVCHAPASSTSAYVSAVPPATKSASCSRLSKMGAYLRTQPAHCCLPHEHAHVKRAKREPAVLLPQGSPTPAMRTRLLRLKG